MKSRFSILLAVLALIASTLACSLTETSLNNLRTAKDQDGAQAATVFGKDDTVFVVGDLSNGVKGNVVTSKWYVDKAEGYEAGSLIDTSDLNIEENGSYSINFYMDKPTDGWPVGSYKVEIFFNSELKSTLNFTVE